MIILKITKDHGFTLSLEDTFSEKPQGGQIDPASRFRVKESCNLIDQQEEAEFCWIWE